MLAAAVDTAKQVRHFMATGPGKSLLLLTVTLLLVDPLRATERQSRYTVTVRLKKEH